MKKQMKIIIYGSKYGTAKRYAEALSEKTGIEAKSFDEIKNTDGCETVVYIGALYAGGVLGMSKTLKKISDPESKKIIIATVGLADPNDEKNTADIKNGIKRQLPREIYEKASIYHLRGGIDYSKLNFPHKTMMSLLYKKAKALPEEKKTAEVKTMIDTYNTKVDFADFSALNAIAENLGE